MMCPKCSGYLPAKAIVCGNCDWVKGQSEAPKPSSQPACTHCHAPNPYARLRHWLELLDDHEYLSFHLKQEFPSYYKRNPGELHMKLRELITTRSRFTQMFADDSGRWLSPLEAMDAYYSRRPHPISQPKGAL